MPTGQTTTAPGNPHEAAFVSESRLVGSLSDPSECGSNVTLPPPGAGGAVISTFPFSGLDCLPRAKFVQTNDLSVKSASDWS